MSEIFVLEIMELTLYTAALLSAPPLITMILVGLISQIVQTVTQLKDQSLTFIPKVIISGIVMLFLIPWYIQTMKTYSQTVFSYISRGPQ